MKIRLVQCGAALGEFEKNFAFHSENIKKAASEGIDIIVFPELSLTGYLLRDLISDVALEADELVGRFSSITTGGKAIEVVCGYVEKTRGGRYYNAAAHALITPDGRASLLRNHRKANLPTYGMFEEQRYFSQGLDVKAYDSPLLGRCGLLICEDLWHVANPLLLSLDGPDLDGARFIIALSNSPSRGVDAASEGSPRNLSLWKDLCLVYAQLFNAYVLHCQRVGVEEGLVFSGGSLVVSPEGEILAEAPALDDWELDAAFESSAALRRARLKFAGRSGDDFFRLHAALERLRGEYVVK